MTKQEQFFYDHGAHSWNPATETVEEGRLRCALEYTRAENEARDLGWTVDVAPDGWDYGWQGDCFDRILDEQNFIGEQFTGYDVTLYDAAGKVIGSLGAVTFKDNNPREPYRRVVAAELALQALHELEAAR